MTPAAPPPSGAAWLASALGGMLLVAAAALLWGVRPAQSPALWAVGGILSLALAPLLAGPWGRAGYAGRLVGLAAALAVALAYFGLEAVSRHWLGVRAAPASPALVVWVMGCFALLFAVQGAVRVRPHGALARGLYPWLFSGLYLDELFTRLTFRLWPARLPPAPAASPSACADTAATRATGAL